MHFPITNRSLLVNVLCVSVCVFCLPNGHISSASVNESHPEAECHLFVLEFIVLRNAGFANFRQKI